LGGRLGKKRVGVCWRKGGENWKLKVEVGRIRIQDRDWVGAGGGGYEKK